jgi:UDP-3-O-[3-hydroxymyristoyl] glucosamine N-acyltransferase
MIGGQVGFVGHIEIADGTKINAQSGVSKSVKEKGKALTGSPAYDYAQSLRSQTIFRHLPELEKRIEHLENTFQKKSLEKENGTISENY